jgi:hypothetical protein
MVAAPHGEFLNWTTENNEKTENNQIKSSPNALI